MPRVLLVVLCAFSYIRVLKHFFVWFSHFAMIFYLSVPDTVPSSIIFQQNNAVSTTALVRLPVAWSGLQWSKKTIVCLKYSLHKLPTSFISVWSTFRLIFEFLISSNAALRSLLRSVSFINLISYRLPVSFMCIFTTLIQTKNREKQGIENDCLKKMYKPTITIDASWPSKTDSWSFQLK